MIFLTAVIIILSLYFHFKPSFKFSKTEISISFTTGGRFYDDRKSIKIYKK